MKKEIKKLVLKKEVIADLTQNEMNSLVGGYGYVPAETEECFSVKYCGTGGSFPDCASPGDDTYGGGWGATVLCPHTHPASMTCGAYTQKNCYC